MGSRDDVGRLIKILDGKQYANYRSGWNADMDDLINNTYEIRRYSSNNDSYLIYDEYDVGWYIDCDKCVFIEEEEINPCGDIMLIL